MSSMRGKPLQEFSIRLRHHAPDQVAHLSQTACALIMDLIVAQVKLCELVIGVLLESPRQVPCTCSRISNLSTLSLFSSQCCDDWAVWRCPERASCDLTTACSTAPGLQ